MASLLCGVLAEVLPKGLERGEIDLALSAYKFADLHESHSYRSVDSRAFQFDAVASEVHTPVFLSVGKAENSSQVLGTDSLHIQRRKHPLKQIGYPLQTGVLRVVKVVEHQQR